MSNIRYIILSVTKFQPSFISDRNYEKRKNAKKRKENLDDMYISQSYDLR